MRPLMFITFMSIWFVIHSDSKDQHPVNEQALNCPQSSDFFTSLFVEISWRSESHFEDYLEDQTFTILK